MNNTELQQAIVTTLEIDAQAMYADCWDLGDDDLTMAAALEIARKAQADALKGFDVRIRQNDYRLVITFCSEVMPHLFTSVRFEFPTSNNKLTGVVGYWEDTEGRELNYY